jgi:hypothetical protein
VIAEVIAIQWNGRQILWRPFFFFRVKKSAQERAHRARNTDDPRRARQNPPGKFLRHI